MEPKSLRRLELAPGPLAITVSAGSVWVTSGRPYELDEAFEVTPLAPLQIHLDAPHSLQLWTSGQQTETVGVSVLYNGVS